MIVDPSDNNLKPSVLGQYAGKGFYYPSNLLTNGFAYADSDDLDTMASDQIQKMQTQRPSPDSKMFGLDWTLTQTTKEAVLGVPNILELANWANPYIGIKLWPYINKQCYPNVLVTDNVNSLTTAFAIAINDLTFP